MSMNNVFSFFVIPGPKNVFICQLKCKNSQSLFADTMNEKCSKLNVLRAIDQGFSYKTALIFFAVKSKNECLRVLMYICLFT